MKRKFLLTTLLLTLCIPFLPAQAAEPAADPVPAKLYLYTAGPEPGAAEERLLTELVVLHLSRGQAVTLLEGEIGAAVPEQDEEKTRRAAEAEADAWLELRAGRQGGDLVVAARLYLLKAERFAAEAQLSTPGSVSAMADDFWEKLLAAVDEGLPRRRQRIEVDTRVVEINEIKAIPYEVGTLVTVKARPGTRINGLASYPLYVAAGGTVSVEVAPNATYRLEADHWRYLPEVQKIYTGKSPQTVEFEQEQGARFAVEGVIHTEKSLGIGTRYYPLPGILFTDLRVINSFQSLLPPYDFEGDSHRWFSRNLFLSFNVGAYLNRQSRRLRFGMAAGGFVRFFSNYNDPGLKLHPVFPYGLNIGPVFELSAGRRFSLFFEWMPEIYIYIPFDEFLTDGGQPYEGMERFPWDEIGGEGNIRINMNSTFLGVRYRF